MSVDQVKGRIDKILVELFELDESEVTPEKNLFTDLGLDSLDAIDLVIKFQKDFAIRPSNEELRAIRTVQDVHRLAETYYEKNQ